MTGRNGNLFRVLTNFLAFIALVFIAISLLVGKFVGPETNFGAICVEISRYAGYALVGLASFWYVMSKRGLLVKIIWAVSVATIVILMFL